LQYQVAFDLPTIDITPPNDTTSPLPPGNNQFTLATNVTVAAKSGASTPSCQLGLYLRCNVASGGSATSFIVADVKITGVSPPGLEAVLEAIIKVFAQQLLSSFRVPIGSFELPPVTLVLQVGPLAENNSIEVRGDVI
jgi:hypothetical protein